jgi:hypothetical protein
MYQKLTRLMTERDNRRLFNKREAAAVLNVSVSTLLTAAQIAQP